MTVDELNESKPTHIDLFSGIGGFAIAAQWAGFRTVAFCEIDAYCQAVLKERFGAVLADAKGQRITRRRVRSGKEAHRKVEHMPACDGRPDLWPDIRTLDGCLYRGAHLLTGGFPCQPFSVAGKRAGAADDRFLWPEMLRVIDEARPSWVLGENVAGIVQMELDRVLSDLENLGYSCWPIVIPACAVDARHRRDRVWIMGHAGGERRQQKSGGAHGHEGQNERWATLQANQPASSGEDVVKPDRPRLRHVSALHPGNWEQGQGKRDYSAVGGPSRWLPEPDVGRVAHGVSKRVDRLKGLGNAIVPQVAYEILREIRSLI